MQRFALRASKTVFSEAAAIPAPNPASGKTFACSTQFINLFKGIDGHKLFVISSAGAGIAIPGAILFANTALSAPFEAALALTVPYHMWFGTKLVLEDYVPKPIRATTINAWAVVSVIAGVGLARVALGPGIGKSIRSIWGPAKKDQKRLD